jgi:hypothetical protein
MQLEQIVRSQLSSSQIQSLPPSWQWAQCHRKWHLLCLINWCFITQCELTWGFRVGVAGRIWRSAWGVPAGCPSWIRWAEPPVHSLAVWNVRGMMCKSWKRVSTFKGCGSQRRACLGGKVMAMAISNRAWERESGVGTRRKASTRELDGHKTWAGQWTGRCMHTRMKGRKDDDFIEVHTTP